MDEVEKRGAPGLFPMPQAGYSRELATLSAGVAASLGIDQERHSPSGNHGFSGIEHPQI